jgi:hypothetical protein
MISDSELEKLVAKYIDQIRRDEVDEIGQFQGRESLKDAIELAASGKDIRGDHFNHQRRILKAADVPATEALVAAEEDMRTSRTFDDLLSIIEFALRGVRGAGELYAYDTAFRIGAKLSLLPDKVFLHAEVRTGAIALGFTGRERCIGMDEFQRPLRVLTPWELESFLCVAAGDLVALRGR